MLLMWVVMTLFAAGVSLWLLLEVRAAPRRRRTAQRETAALLRLELSQRPDRRFRRLFLAAEEQPFSRGTGGGDEARKVGA
jgi:hypothetical protein